MLIITYSQCNYSEPLIEQRPQAERILAVQRMMSAFPLNADVNASNIPIPCF